MAGAVPARGSSGPPSQPPGGKTSLALRRRHIIPQLPDGSHALTAALSGGDGASAAPGWELTGTVPPQQIAMWQQQMRMMESFHDDMMLMIQMFMAMHREHLGAVQGELDKVRELSRELGRLQGQLGQPSSAPKQQEPRDADDPADELKSAQGLRSNGAGHSTTRRSGSPDQINATGATQPFSSPADPGTTIPPACDDNSVSQESSQTRYSPGEHTTISC